MPHASSNIVVEFSSCGRLQKCLISWTLLAPTRPSHRKISFVVEETDTNTKYSLLAICTLVPENGQKSSIATDKNPTFCQFWIPFLVTLANV